MRRRGATSTARAARYAHCADLLQSPVAQAAELRREGDVQYRVMGGTLEADLTCSDGADLASIQVSGQLRDWSGSCSATFSDQAVIEMT